MGQDICCATTGELRKVVEDVAEKAAERAVDTMYYKLKADFAEMEKRISNDISDRVDARIQDFLGMTAQEHIIQHDRIKQTNDLFGGIRSAFWKRVITSVLLVGMALAGGYSASLASGLGKAHADTVAITRDDYAPLTSEDDDESNP